MRTLDLYVGLLSQHLMTGVPAPLDLTDIGWIVLDRTMSYYASNDTHTTNRYAALFAALASD